MTKTVRAVPGWVGPFLEQLAQTGSIAGAAEAAGIAPPTAHQRRARHRDFAQAMEAALGSFRLRTGAPALRRPAPRPRDRTARFLEALGETSNVKAACEAAAIAPATIYKLRRSDPDFARRWYAALAEGYDNLEMELLGRLRAGENGEAAAGKARFDTATALRCLTAHRESVAREKGRRTLEGEVATIAAINAKIDALRARGSEAGAAIRRARKAAAKRRAQNGDA